MAAGHEDGEDAREHGQPPSGGGRGVEVDGARATSGPTVSVWQSAQEPSRPTCVSIGCVTVPSAEDDACICVG